MPQKSYAITGVSSGDLAQPSEIRLLSRELTGDCLHKDRSIAHYLLRQHGIIRAVHKDKEKSMKDTYTAIMKQSGPWWIG